MPRLSVPAAAGLALLMVGATVANVTSLDTSPATTIIIFLVALLAAWLGLRQTSRGTTSPVADVASTGAR